MAVFLRFLSLLHFHDWQREPLIVNFNSELSGWLCWLVGCTKFSCILNVLTAATQLSDACLEFAKNRPSLPPLVIITPHDHQCPPNSPLTQRSPWTTSSAPSPPVAYRLQQLAGEALSLLSGMVLDAGSIDMDTAKVSPTILQQVYFPY